MVLLSLTYPNRMDIIFKEMALAQSPEVQSSNPKPPFLSSVFLSTKWISTILMDPISDAGKSHEITKMDPYF